MARIESGLRADPDEAGIDDGLREIGVLGEKAVAGMDRFGAGLLRGGDDLVAAQIAFFRRRRADVHGVIGLAHMQRIGVRVGINRDRAHAETSCTCGSRAGRSLRDWR